MKRSNPEDNSLDARLAIEEQLGPFDPPASYSFEPELRAPIPRPIPDVLREGPYGQGQKNLLVGLLVATVFCLIAAVIPVIRHWGDYLLPLAYIGWIGGGLALLTAGVWLKQRYAKGHYAYVESGQPLVGRIGAMTLRCQLVINGTPTAYQFAALVEYQHPQTGALTIAELTSQDISAGVKDKRTCSFRVGEYVTLVYLGRKPDHSLRIYGFLGLRPEMGVINRDGDVSKSGLQTAMEVAAVFAGIFLFVYSMLKAIQYFPIETPSAVVLPAVVGATVSVGIGSWLIHRYRSRRNRQMEERNAAAAINGEAIELQVDRSGLSDWFYTAIIGFGLALLGVGVLCGALFSANAWLDQSPPRHLPIEITEMIQTTHNFVLRDYSIKYQLAGETETHTYRTSLDDIERFPGLSPNAIVREGAFGWPWVERLEPEMPANAPQPPSQPGVLPP